MIINNVNYFENKEALRQEILKKIDKPAVEIDVKELRLLLDLYDGPSATHEDEEIIEKMKNNLLQIITADTTPH